MFNPRFFKFVLQKTILQRKKSGLHKITQQYFQYPGCSRGPNCDRDWDSANCTFEAVEHSGPCILGCQSPFFPALVVLPSVLLGSQGQDPWSVAPGSYLAWHHEFSRWPSSNGREELFRGLHEVLQTSRRPEWPDRLPPSCCQCQSAGQS